MPYTQTTLEAFRTALTRRWDSSVFWTAEEARLAINEILRDWNLLTGQWRRTGVAIATGAANPAVTLPASLLTGLRVTYAGQPVWPTSVTELDFSRTTWRLETTASGSPVPTRPWFWAPESLRRIVIWPATAAVGSITVEGLSATPILVEDADHVDLGEELLDVLTDAALHVLLFKEGGPRWRASTKAWQAFLAAAADAHTQLKASQKYRRWMGLDRRRDLDPPKVGQSALAPVEG